MEGPGTTPGASDPALPPEPPDTPAGPRRFGPGAALLVFLAYFGAQILGGAVVGIVAGLRAAVDREPVGDVVARNLPAMLLMGLAFSGAGALVAARALVGPLRPSGRFALRGTSARGLAAGIATGVALGLLLLAVMRLLAPTPHDTPLTRLAGTEIGRWVLVFAALVLAPPIEEFVFRGVLYEGFRERMPAAVAMLLVTVLFTALHLTEVVHYAPAIGLIALLSVATLLLRTATGSLLPAVAAHFTYNAFAITG